MPSSYDGNSALGGLIAGALSGVIADVSTHWLSTVKTRLQCQGAAVSSAGAVSTLYRGPISACYHIARNEGLGALYKGVGIVVLAAAPAQALYFLGYETFKAAAGDSVFSSFGAGMCAQLSASCIWVPMDVVKERLQLEGQMKTTEKMGSSINALKRIVATEGVSGLYRAYFIHQLTWVPFNALYFAVYDALRLSLKKNLVSPPPDATINFQSGIVAGIVASVATSPLDLVKTRMQVLKANPTLFDYTGPIDATVKIVKREGVKALFDGLGARILWLTPRLSIAVSTYSYFSDMFRDW